MKKRIYFSCFAAFCLNSLAQGVSNGFYRVLNYGTQRYAYVYDCTGSINIQNTSADMGAIVLFKNPEKRFSDPASVIYISDKGVSPNNSQYHLYDLESQGTGVNKIINYYVNVVKTNITNTYYVYESQYSQYLCDPVTDSSVDKSYVSTGAVKNNQLRCWSVLPVSAASDEYLGIAPDGAFKVGNKYYKPYYLGFAMNFASNGMKAYYVSEIKSDAVIVNEITGTVPAATPLIVECSSANISDNRINPLYQQLPPISGNKLSGNYFCYEGHGETAYKEYDPSTMRLLCVKDGHLSYTTDVEHKYCVELLFVNGRKSTTKYCIPANSSYLQVPAGTATDLPVMTQAEYDALHPATKKGDINGDGSVNSTDALVLNRIIASGKTAAQNPEADINGDGQVNSTDALVLNRIIASGK